DRHDVSAESRAEVSVMERAALAFDRVSCAFAGRNGTGRYIAVKDASLTVAPGEFVSVVGPTGCGKSTLLNFAAGLLAPFAGINTRAGYMFQSEALMPWRSALANVVAGLEFHHVARDESAERARDWL